MALAHAPSADGHCIRGGAHPPKVRMGLAQQVLGAGRSGQLQWQALRDREIVPPRERLPLPCASTQCGFAGTSESTSVLPDRPSGQSTKP